MSRFAIRDSLWLTVVAPLLLSLTQTVRCQEESLDIEQRTDEGGKGVPDLLNSSWVVNDAYALNKAVRGPIGVTIVISKGKITLADKTGITSFEIRLTEDAPAGSFEMLRDGQVVSKALAIRDEEGRLHLFLNHSKKIRPPPDVVPVRAKCMETFVCLPLSEVEGRARLAAAAKGRE
jgi:hypothetical protein